MIFQYMKSIAIAFCFLLSAFGLLNGQAFADAQPLSLDADNFQQILVDNNGSDVFKSSGNDAYIVTDKLDTPVKDISGVVIEPALFELFWTTDDTGFNETQKAMFLLPAKQNKAYSIYLPLADLYNFAGYGLNEIAERVLTSIRLDLPAVEGFELRLDSFKLVKQTDSVDPTVTKIEPIERMLLHSKGKGAALSHKMKVTFAYGVKRLFADSWFAVIWLLMIFLVLCLLVCSAVTNRAKY